MAQLCNDSINQLGQNSAETLNEVLAKTAEKTVAVQAVQDLSNLERQQQQTSLERDSLSIDEAKKEAQIVRKIFENQLGHDDLSWAERKLVGKSAYDKGIDVFFCNLNDDIECGCVRSLEDGLCAVVDTLGGPKSLVKKFQQKIETNAPDLKARYENLQSGLTSPVVPPLAKKLVQNETQILPKSSHNIPIIVSPDLHFDQVSLHLTIEQEQVILQEVAALQTLFEKELGYQTLSWLEKKFIKKAGYQRGIDTFFKNLRSDVKQRHIRSYDEAVTAATKAISRKNGDKVKSSMLKKIQNELPVFKTRYEAIFQQVNNPDSHAV